MGEQSCVSTINNLTPVEEINGIFYKRDDYFKPFIDSSINGGKVRQCLSLLYNNREIIKNEYGGRVATASSVHSPQGIIVARVAKELGFKSLLAVGGSKSVDELVKIHKNLKICRDLGCDVRNVTKMPYNNVLYSKLNEIDEKDGKYFKVLFGMNISTNPDSIIGVTENQVKNIPSDLCNLVIPVGSGISCGGILSGLIKNNIKPKNIYLVQISGYDRNDTIDEILGLIGVKIKKVTMVETSEKIIKNQVELSNDWSYYFIMHNMFPYAKWIIPKDISFEIDGRYEAKAYHYMFNNIDYKNEKTLFWIIGNSKVKT